MDTNLTPDQISALRASDDNRLTVVDPTTKRRYVIVDADTLMKIESLYAISQGLNQMEQGDGQALANAMADVRDILKRRDECSA